MFYRTKSGITKKASRETGALYFLSRRAHLLTTDRVGGVPLRGRALYEVMCRRDAPIFYNRYTRKEVIAYRHIPS